MVVVAPNLIASRPPFANLAMFARVWIAVWIHILLHRLFKTFTTLRREGGAESAEALLSSYDPPSPNAGRQNAQEWYWHGQYFTPTLPAEATA